MAGGQSCQLALSRRGASTQNYLDNGLEKNLDGIM